MMVLFVAATCLGLAVWALWTMDSPLSDDAPPVVNLTVRAYAEQVRKMTLEEAAGIAEKWPVRDVDGARAREGIASKIRELAKEKRS